MEANVQVKRSIEKGLTRRLFCSGCVATGAIAYNFTPAFGCGSPLSTFAANALIEENTSGQWAFTVAPNAVEAMESRITLAENEIANAISELSTVRWKVALDAINFVGAGAIFLLGVSGAAAAAPLYIGALSLSGSILVVRSAIVPGNPIDAGFLTERGVSHLGGLLSAGADDVVAASTSVGNKSLVAGRILGGVSVIVSGWTLLKSINEESERRTYLIAQQHNLANLKRQIQKLRDAEIANQFRTDCMNSLRSNLDYAILQCTDREPD